MTEIDQSLLDTIVSIGASLKEKKEMLSTAESCTGGWVGQAITSVPGTSHWYDRGFITYSNAAKREMLDVPTGTLARFGAVSEQTARAMAEGAVRNSQSRFALSITGIAGPEGGTPEKPVGFVCFAWTGHDRETFSECVRFKGDRQQVRRQAVSHALLGMSGYIDKT